VGVDISDAGFDRTRELATESGVADRLELRREDVTEYRSAREADVVLCVGAAYAFGELLPALKAAGDHLAEDGIIAARRCCWSGLVSGNKC
jgi:cyclopropane fatty-acyl-phospholipid synthase-like methyltransferase